MWVLSVGSWRVLDDETKVTPVKTITPVAERLTISQAISGVVLLLQIILEIKQKKDLKAYEKELQREEARLAREA